MSEEIAVAEWEEPAQAVTLFGTNDPGKVIEAATAAAKPLADVVRKQKLTATISGREHVRVEGWTLLGSMLGVFPVCVWTRKLDDGWEARVEARTRAGEVVGAAEAECLRSERTWKDRDDYALRSMAQTRATSKALRQPLGFVMQLAGFDATPAEEMPQGGTQAAPVGAGDPSSLLPEEMVVHFGKNAGVPLVELTAQSLAWYADKWEPGDTEQDIALKRAAIALKADLELPF